MSWPPYTTGPHSVGGMHLVVFQAPSDPLQAWDFQELASPGPGPEGVPAMQAH